MLGVAVRRFPWHIDCCYWDLAPYVETREATYLPRHNVCKLTHPESTDPQATAANILHTKQYSTSPRPTNSPTHFDATSLCCRRCTIGEHNGIASCSESFWRPLFCLAISQHRVGAAAKHYAIFNWQFSICNFQFAIFSTPLPSPSFPRIAPGTPQSPRRSPPPSRRPSSACR